jgi:hypothetical protein
MYLAVFAPVKNKKPTPRKWLSRNDLEFFDNPGFSGKIRVQENSNGHGFDINYIDYIKYKSKTLRELTPKVVSIYFSRVPNDQKLGRPPIPI